jgi:hypothetical protein
MNPLSRRVALFCLLAASCLAAPAQAYVGPGAGVTLIGALLGLLSAILLALWAVVRWPIRRLLARRKAAQAGGPNGPAESGDSGPNKVG